MTKWNIRPHQPNRTVVWLWRHILTLQVNAEVHRAITQLCFSPSSILCSRQNCTAWCSANWKVNCVFEVISCHSCKSDSSSSPWDQVHICLNGWGPTTGLLENIWSLKVPFMEYFLIKIKLKNSMQNWIPAMNYCWKQSATFHYSHPTQGAPTGCLLTANQHKGEQATSMHCMLLLFSYIVFLLGKSFQLATQE